MDKNDKSFLERIRTKVRKAITDYQLVQDNDTIVVGVSGGKDSMALLDILHNRRKSIGIAYQIVAVHIQLTDVPYYTDAAYLQEFCSKRDIPFHILKDDVTIVNSEKQPCFYCAWNRRKLLFQFAADHRYTKVAFGHHRDDMVETLLMNMIYHGEMSAFPVKLSMFDDKISIIRPLVYTTDKELQRYVKLINYKPLPYDCDFATTNHREKFKDLLKQLYTLNPNATKNIFKAMTHIDMKHLPFK